ncbi:hypothetical protein SEA_CHEWCHEW_36 [Arthrobacter phage ChewChew]|uniref:Uncharacterized protein n=3 Tax=Korravirus drrobert TaxID=1982078 RepID=A0A222ZIF5_9CAUD|nr:hypothetical protein SEA_LUCY_36 [Arthrobacter phage Lucy]ASR83830.1 hypothetical protein SEA_PITADOG_36 [Arthrobacter phage PitaDog]AZS07019.1 hypothetical protein SEA_CHEWCHEW_36 [Arthrobacter phage ChewChew]
MNTHYTATVDISKVSRETGTSEYNSTTRRNETKPGARVVEEVMRVTLRDESLPALVRKVTAIMEVNVPTPATVEAREGE